MSIKAGATSQTINLVITDTDGDPLTGLTYASSGLTCYYVRAGAASASVTLATLAAAGSAWASGGFKEIDATNCPGLYRLDVPNAAIASGVPHVTLYLRGATSMAPAILKIDLVAYNPQDASSFGLSDVLRGPLYLYVNGVEASDEDTLYVGETPNLVVNVMDRLDRPSSVASTVVANITRIDTGASVEADIDCTVRDAALGIVEVPIPTAATDTGLAGKRLRLTLSWESASRTIIAGAITLEIKAR